MFPGIILQESEVLPKWALCRTWWPNFESSGIGPIDKPMAVSYHHGLCIDLQQLVQASTYLIADISSRGKHLRVQDRGNVLKFR